MDAKLIKQLMLYSLPVLAYFVITYAAQPKDDIQQTGGPSINIIEYPGSGPNSTADSGYIAAYYALQKLGINITEDRQTFLLNSKNIIKNKRLLDAAEVRVRTDLQDFIEKKPAPAISPIPGISSQDLKDIILSAIPDIAKVVSKEYVRVNFDPKTGQLGDRTLELTGNQLFADIAKSLSLNQERYQIPYKINWSMLEPDITKDNYQVLKDFTGLRDVSELQVIKKEVIETLQKEFAREENIAKQTDATGHWLRPEELASLIIANTKDVEKVIILSDLGILLSPAQEGVDRTQEIEQIFNRIKTKMATAGQGTQTFIIDKAYVRGKPEQQHIWVPIIVNKQGNQLRLAIIDPENQIKQDNPYVKILLKQLS